MTKPTGSFPPNSMGALNGLNYETVAITPGMPIDDLVAAFQLT